MATKAQCPKCKIKFEWDNPLVIKNLHCPDCGDYVKRSSKKSEKYPLYLGIFPSSIHGLMESLKKRFFG